ncbi:hypothetical protein [Aurantimonas sp. Leaf443]|uniref:hypothetical protein n=1 Tax=Aurantimonas sp. Leaf443 TaxID=1736378 RepID=UPI0006FF5A6A|nr:hypothetical protein [Aurantimonas sp. Leaf443]KQT85328.1 hypothetical protein ASG48_08755 [Aurantimonas sp. Leaf443]
MKPSSPAGSPPTPDLVPNVGEILRYFSGVAMLMGGKAEGLKRLDLSADGFWQSFSAILVAAPAVALSWLEFELVERPGPAIEASAFSIYATHAMADLLGWLLPILVLMTFARRLGIGRKIVPLVVVSNWGGAFLAWAFSPYWLLLFAFGPGPETGALGVLVTIASLVLTVRLVHLATGRDMTLAIGTCILMVLSSLVAYGAVMDLTGIALLR